MKKLLLVLFGILLGTQISYGAIAIVSSTTVQGTAGAATSLTYAAPSISGTDKLGIVCEAHGTAATTTGITWNGSPMTLAVYQFQTAGNTGLSTWYIVNPSAGNVVISMSSSITIRSYAAVYSGVHQSSPVDGTSFNGNRTTSQTSLASTITTSFNNSWAFACVVAGSASALTAGANTQIGSQPEATAYGTAWIHTNGPLATAGTDTMNITSSSQILVSAMMGIREAVSATVLPSMGAMLRYFRLR